jgi:pyruvate,orthophosphate dikinase
LQEADPMLGRRDVRVGVTYPDLYYYAKQSHSGGRRRVEERGLQTRVEIIIPQVSDVREIIYVKEGATLPAPRDVEREFDVKLDVKIGTMIETVRERLTIDEIAKHVDFICFGTNDLTQAVFSFSRDDAENKFMPQYLELKILDANPFETIDVKGIGRLVEYVAAA